MDTATLLPHAPVPLSFSPWHYWENKQQILEPHPSETHFLLGVYCLAFTNKISEQAPMTWDKVAYIGMSARDGGLMSRWREVDRALSGKRGHSGANHIFADLDCIPTPSGGWRISARKLLVSAVVVPVDRRSTHPEKVRSRGIVAYLEYEAFAQFCLAKSRIKTPRYNSGGKSR